MCLHLVHGFNFKGIGRLVGGTVYKPCAVVNQRIHRGHTACHRIANYNPRIGEQQRQGGDRRRKPQPPRLPSPSIVYMCSIVLLTAGILSSHTRYTRLCVNLRREYAARCVQTIRVGPPRE